MTALPANPFMNSGAHVPVASGSAADSLLPPSKSPAALSVPIYECENCIGMIEYGCYCQAMGAVAPGGPCAEPIPQPTGSLVGATSMASACAPMSPEKHAPADPAAENGCCGAVREPFDTDHIPEIFRVANLLCETRQFVPNEAAIYFAMMSECSPRLRADDPVWTDEAPLFLKDIA